MKKRKREQKRKREKKRKREQKRKREKKRKKRMGRRKKNEKQFEKYAVCIDQIYLKNVVQTMNHQEQYIAQ